LADIYKSRALADHCEIRRFSAPKCKKSRKKGHFSSKIDIFHFVFSLGRKVHFHVQNNRRSSESGVDIGGDYGTIDACVAMDAVVWSRGIMRKTRGF